MRAPWIAAWLAFVVLAMGASPAHFWLDAAEIGAAGYGLGVAHPPGAPGLLLLLRLGSLLPLGSLGFRMALVDCALGAATVGLVVAILERRGASAGLSLTMGAWILTGLTFVRQARVVEVYALAAALLMVTLWGLDPKVGPSRRTSRRLLAVVAATWAAWCFGDLRLALGPQLLVLWIQQLRAKAPWARWAPAVAIMASLVILALPLASIGGPRVDWGDPDTLPAMIDHLAARSIRESFADQILPASWSMWGVNASGAVTRLAEDLGVPGLTVAAACLVFSWRRDPSASSAKHTTGAAMAIGWIVLVEAFYIVGINPMGGVDRQTGLVLAPLAALVVGDVARRWLSDRGRLSWAVLPLLGAVLVVPPALRSAADLEVTRSWAPHAWTRATLAQLPPGALLLTQSDDLAAGTVSAALLEGARPDVISIPAQHLYKPTSEFDEADPRRARLWAAAHGQSTETSRIVATLEAHVAAEGRDDAVAIEFPRTGLFTRVNREPSGLRLPLGTGAPPPAEVEYWLPRLGPREDRRRLAIALANWARARVRQRPEAIVESGATLSLSLSQVDDRHASALVTLAALRDRTGDLAGAIALTRRALEIEPERHAALTNLALYLSRSDDPAAIEEATALARRAVDLRPWRADGWVRLVGVLTVAGDEAGAAAARARAEAIGDARR